MNEIRVTTDTPDGITYDLTSEAEGVTFSNVNPGGDEVASFSLKRQFGTQTPEIAQGSILRIVAGLDVLWQGRIDEISRSADAVELVDVAAYGLGIRLREEIVQRIYVDRAGDSWQPPTLDRRLAITGADNPLDEAYSGETRPQGLKFDGSTNRSINSGSGAELMYVCPPEIKIGRFQCLGSEANLGNIEAATLYAADDDTAMATTDSYTLTLSLTTLEDKALTTTRNYLMLRMRASGTHTKAAVDSPGERTYTRVAVFGSHGLAPIAQTGEPSGFAASQIIDDVVGQTEGVDIERREGSSTVLDHLVFLEPTEVEEVIGEVNRYEGFDWGTWPSSDVLDRSDTGRFYFTARQADPSWIVSRSQLDEADFGTELSTLYNRILLTYEDTDGNPQTYEQTTTVDQLDEAGITRTAVIDGGELTRHMAAQLAASFLAVQGTRSPARGSVTISQPIDHVTRGTLPPYYLRADGSQMRVRDFFPPNTMIGLEAAPDRLTTYPVNRVEVSLAGDKPVVRADLEQGFDALSVLQARLALAGEYTPRSRKRRKHGRKGGGGDPGPSHGGRGSGHR